MRFPMSLEHSPARQRLRKAHLARPDHKPIVVYSFREWCGLVGVSLPTGYRLLKQGKIKTVQLSARRIGVRSDEHERFLDAGKREV